jgi:transcriptional regulator of acetoin/glycerol metabolism
MSDREKFTNSLNEYSTATLHRDYVMELVKTYGTSITLHALLNRITERISRLDTELFDAGLEPLPEKCGWKEYQKLAIQNALAECDGNVTKAAKAVGLSRATMYRRIAEYNL